MFDHLFSIRVFFSQVQMCREAYILERIDKSNNYEVRPPNNDEKMTESKTFKIFKMNRKNKREFLGIKHIDLWS